MMKHLAKKIASDVLMERLNVPMMGTLNCDQKDGDYAILEVPKDFTDAVYDAIKEDGMERPEYGAHISVMTDEELKQVGQVEEDGQKFECLACGHVEDADVNAAFVIALRHQGILRLPADRDAGKGSTDTPEEATSKKAG
jgi:hypothetical protein